MQIECRSCDSPKCEGCNIYILATMLHEGKLDCLMDEHHSIAITPESLRPKGEWIHREYDETDDSDEYYYCSECHEIALSEFGRYTYVRSDFCPNCGADMRGEVDATC